MTNNRTIKHTLPVGMAGYYKEYQTGCSIHHSSFICSIGRSFSIIFFLCQLSNAFCQLAKVDSLKNTLLTAKEDTSKVNNLIDIGLAYKFNDPDSALRYQTRAFLLARKINWLSGIGKASHNIASYYYDRGNYTVSLKYYYKAISIWNKLENEGLSNQKSKIRYLKSKTYGNIGLVYADQSDYPRALEYYFKALKLAEEVGNKSGIAVDLANIGVNYWYQGNFPVALDYFFKALKIHEELGNKNDIALTLGNIGVIFEEQADSAFASGNIPFAVLEKHPKALEYYLLRGTLNSIIFKLYILYCSENYFDVLLFNVPHNKSIATWKRT